jgi:hypothetical protein
VDPGNSVAAGPTYVRFVLLQYGNKGGRVLLVLVTDGEPSDGNYDDLKRVRGTCVQSQSTRELLVAGPAVPN